MNYGALILLVGSILPDVYARLPSLITGTSLSTEKERDRGGEKINCEVCAEVVWVTTFDRDNRTPCQPTFLILKQEILGSPNRLRSLIRHGPHRKQRVQQFFYCCLCIRLRCNVSTEQLPSKDRG
jgi:hypothetical protein